MCGPTNTGSERVFVVVDENDKDSSWIRVHCLYLCMVASEGVGWVNSPHAADEVNMCRYRWCILHTGIEAHIEAHLISVVCVVCQ